MKQDVCKSPRPDPRGALLSTRYSGSGSRQTDVLVTHVLPPPPPQLPQPHVATLHCPLPLHRTISEIIK
ncbi:hypothetical protein J6590_022282 [Homalodisca vitripennis]|nr:hypothetical protein J6590_022282 [Homalodisca vitripennis]